MTEQLVVCTHSGAFHADDATALAILTLLYGEDMVKVIRSRDPAVWAEADMLVDVGLEYNVNPRDRIFKFDHHQRESAGVRDNGVPYAAAGLVWRTMGELLVYAMFPKIPPADVPWVVQRVDKTLIQPIDAMDCGVEGAQNNFPIGCCVDDMNTGFDDRMQLEAFLEAVAFMRGILTRRIQVISQEAQDARKVAQGAFVSPHIYVLKESCAWGPAMLSEPQYADVWFLLFEADGCWRVRTIPSKEGSFIARQNLPKAWGGQPASVLNELIGIKDAEFCHPGLFIGGAKSYESAVRMAHLAEEAVLNCS